MYIWLHPNLQTHHETPVPKYIRSICPIQLPDASLPHFQAKPTVWVHLLSAHSLHLVLEPTDLHLCVPIQKRRPWTMGLPLNQVISQLVIN